MRRLLTRLTVVGLAFAAFAASASAATIHVRSTDGVRLAAFTFGGQQARQVVIVIHGGPGNTHAYLGPLPRQLSSPRVLSVAYDQRGVGGSTSPKNHRYTLAAYVEDLDAIRRAVGAARVTLVAHSWGGVVAQAYAAAHPDRVAGLAFLDALSADFNTWIRGSVAFNARLTALQREGLIPDPLPQNHGDSCSPSDDASEPAYLGNPREHVPPWATAGGCRISVDDLTRKAVLSPAVLQPVALALRRVRVPVLVLFGSNDPFGRPFDLESARLLANAHPRVVEIHGAGHQTWIEASALTLAPIRALISSAGRLKCGAQQALCVPQTYRR
jgi:pimeloyl-ACP methyl ester carboxylesterase